MAIDVERIETTETLLSIKDLHARLKAVGAPLLEVTPISPAHTP
jgi:hypothetical protein